MQYPVTETTQKKINSIVQNQSGCYIFCGDDNLGKLEAIEEIAKKLLDSNNFEKLRNDFSEEFIEVSPKENKAISITEIHDLNKKLWQKSSSKQRLVVINGIDNIGLEAANATLKNLEDSPDNTVFLLIASHLSSVLPTIVSRSQIINFELPEKSSLIEYISKQYNVSQHDTKEVLDIALGNPDLAIEIINNNNKEDYRLLAQQANVFATKSITEKFVVADAVYQSKKSREFIQYLTYTLRSESTILNHVEVLESILQACKQIDFNVNPRLVLENLALQLEGE